MTLKKTIHASWHHSRQCISWGDGKALIENRRVRSDCTLKYTLASMQCRAARLGTIMREVKKEKFLVDR